MQTPTPFAREWQIKPLLLLNVVTFLLLASWLWPTTRQLWDGFDDHLFKLLNGSLHYSHDWAFLWALTSVRPMDLVMGLIMFWVMTRKNWAFSGYQLRKGVIAFFLLLALMLAFRPGFTDLCDWLGWQHASPSVLENYAIHLSQLFPDWQTFSPKDHASHSFPGDHASILLLWALFLSFFAKGWRLFTIWALTLLFMMPRLVAGAHWGSDDFVGGLFLSLQSIAWGCYTPLLGTTSQWLDKRVVVLLRKFKRGVGLNRPRKTQYSSK